MFWEVFENRTPKGWTGQIEERFQFKFIWNTCLNPTVVTVTSKKKIISKFCFDRKLYKHFLNIFYFGLDPKIWMEIGDPSEFRKCVLLESGIGVTSEAPFLEIRLLEGRSGLGETRGHLTLQLGPGPPVICTIRNSTHVHLNRLAGPTRQLHKTEQQQQHKTAAGCSRDSGQNPANLGLYSGEKLPEF